MKCDWCGRKIKKTYEWAVGEDDFVLICAKCCLKGDGTVEDLSKVEKERNAARAKR